MKNKILLTGPGPKTIINIFTKIKVIITPIKSPNITRMVVLVSSFEFILILF